MTAPYLPLRAPIVNPDYTITRVWLGTMRRVLPTLTPEVVRAPLTHPNGTVTPPWRLALQVLADTVGVLLPERAPVTNADCTTSPAWAAFFRQVAV